MINKNLENSLVETTEKNTVSSIKIKPKYDDTTYKGHNRLAGKKAIITAGNNGVGKAVALAFAKEGADIIMVYNHKKYEKELRIFIKYLEKTGIKVWLFRSCTFDEYKCKQLFENILKKVQKIDILVNTFPIYNKTEIETGHYLLRKTDTLKIQSLFTIGRLAPGYLSKNGVIINSATICAYAQPDQLLFYSALEAAIKNYTSQMSNMLEYYHNKIRVNAITTGFIWTDTFPELIPKYEQLPSCTKSSIPMHPYEVAPLYVFLASDESGSISGETLNAGGRIYKQQ